MRLYDELFFEITLEGTKADLRKFVKFVRSGELDDFFECAEDYLIYDDAYDDTEDSQPTAITFTNDDIGVEISSFNPEDFLDVFCKATRMLDVRGRFYDMDDEEYAFASAAGTDSYANDADAELFNDELDEEARREGAAEDEDEEM